MCRYFTLCIYQAPLA